MLLHYKASFEIQTSSCTGFYTVFIARNFHDTKFVYHLVKNPEISAESQAK